MPGKAGFYPYKKGHESSEELKSKVIKLAYEMTVEIQRTKKVKLTFEQSDFVLKRIQKCTVAG